ncbi:MAG: TIGR04283 family arsenosugar biosynthesis glycosyltransferase [Deltaproteobacteria bacterium]|nr:TIGR04283 family arsenosugar biosynthesis glycosyltransferase [Deltaproteobacteria bacterium]
MTLSIIIPVFNESSVLARTLDHLRSLGPHGQVIVVDGGSTDETVRIAEQYGHVLIVSARGRGVQLHQGARRADGDVLLFLHADTLLPKGYHHDICLAMRDPCVVFGAFSLKIDPCTAFLSLVAGMANLRSRLLKLPYGDQAIFVRRSAYRRAGGFRPWPVMEDVDLVRRLSRQGRFRLISTPVRTSARRWEAEGAVFSTIRNWSVMVRFFLGVPPAALSRRYPDIRKRRSGADTSAQG